MLDEILDSIDFTKFDICVKCVKGKPTKTKKFGAYRAINILELMHTDICGPFPHYLGIVNNILYHS